ncbi:hypothetical protein V473_13510 [Sphingobium cupriresistens LL01]|uniref:Uncharacterized protein n=1 Tax=Sphingobium cupriresistens LL01 TaxID=1420583 RepID=A0A0J8AN19_9SPHN|nr:hypothetical protein V473_13510 [Sphingobium cupriresistens LL01]
MSPWESAVKISGLSQALQEMVNVQENEGWTHKI